MTEISPTEVLKRVIEIPPEELPKHVTIDDVATGIKVWHNPGNRLCVFRLHRSADPKKRTQRWLEETSAGMSYIDYLKEHEIVWSSFAGRPVFIEDWSRAFHIHLEPLRWAPMYPMIRGWDFGLSPAVLFAQLMPYNRLFILREIIGDEIGVERFSEEVKQKSLEWFPGCRKFIDVVDPAGFARKDTDERTCVMIMKIPPLSAQEVIPGVQNPQKRRHSVTEFLTAHDRGLSKLLVDESCEHLIKGFDGGYHYAYKTNSTTLKDQPEKNNYSHVHDALQYICSRVMELDLTATGDVKIPEPKFNFTDPMIGPNPWLSKRPLEL